MLVYNKITYIFILSSLIIITFPILSIEKSNYHYNNTIIYHIQNGFQIIEYTIYQILDVKHNLNFISHNWFITFISPSLFIFALSLHTFISFVFYFYSISYFFLYSCWSFHPPSVPDSSPFVDRYLPTTVTSLHVIYKTKQWCKDYDYNSK